MANPIVVHQLDPYANDPNMRLISQQQVLLAGRNAQRFTYRDARSYCWKLTQVAIALFSNDQAQIDQSLDRFKDHVVHIAR